LAADRLYLDHAATTPMLPQAQAAMVAAMAGWANPSSPHSDGRAARAMLEDARRRIAAALGWDGHVLFTSGASEAIAIALTRAKAARIITSPVEHDAVLRVTKEAERLAVDGDGRVLLPELAPSSLVAIQHVNNETGVIQPLADFRRTGLLHKFGGPPGIGALLIRDLALVEPSGGQEQGYRAGTENLPAIMAMAAALEARGEWMPVAAALRARLDAGIEAAGGEIVARDAPRLPAIASYRMPGLSARAQLIQFDLAGISVSAGSACSSGSLKTSHVLGAMGWDAAAAGEVVRVSFGPQTSAGDVDRFLATWAAMAERAGR
jgi:cysteine desulfurase